MKLPFKPESAVQLPSSIRQYPNGRTPAGLMKLCGLGKFVMVEPAASAMKALVEKAARDGVRLSATGTYRSFDAQVGLFLKRMRPVSYAKYLATRPSHRRKWAEAPKYGHPSQYWVRVQGAGCATPGTSNHGWGGLSVDFAELNERNEVVSLTYTALQWLAANGPAFGWWNTVSSENWHWSYVLGDQSPLGVTVPTADKPIVRPVLRLGDRNVAVSDLQIALRKRGYKIAVDGDFGKQTDRVVRQFQKDNKLFVDGVVGPQTWGALGV